MSSINNEYDYNLSIWHSILIRLGLSRHATLIDLCPGDDPKIERVLDRYGFKGKLYVVDASIKKLNSLTCQLPSTLEYEVIYVAGQVQKIALPEQGHMLGNHIVDDLISFEFCRKMSKDYYKLTEDVNYSRRIWSAIVKSPTYYEEFAIEAIRHISAFVPQNGYLILSQYPSRFERQYGFHDETGLCIRMLDRLSRSLSHDRFVDRSATINTILEEYKLGLFKPCHWIVLQAR